MRRGARAVAFASAALVVVGCRPAERVEAPRAAELDARSGPTFSASAFEEELARADFVGAERRARASDQRAPLARLLLRTGRAGEAARLLAEPRSPAEKVLLARALLDEDNFAEAVAVATPKPNEPEGTPLDGLELGVLRMEALVAEGRRSEAIEFAGVLRRTFEAAAVGSAEGLTLLGRVAHLARDVRGANELYNRAEEAGGKSPRLFSFRGELFLRNYDAAHAGEVLREGLAAAPKDPDLLALLAELRVVDALDFPEAERLAKEALAIHPRHERALGVLVGIALRDADFREAERLLRGALAARPGARRLLAYDATMRFLREDEPGFEERLAQLEGLSPGSSETYAVLADHAEWEHRYRDLDRFLRRAIRKDRKDGSLRGRLGLNLLRFGDEAEAVVELREAYRLDPFDVRVVNTLELFEEAVKKNYVERRAGPFVFRFPKADQALLERYVPRLADEARSAMEQRYGAAPSRIQIELYATKEEFAVRTSGLPQAGISGVCFGRKLAAVVPSVSMTNLGMTLWHELAHVFHLELSGSRVPRWFTEGFAEWETRRLGRGWSREMDLELYEAVRAGALVPVARMNRAFSRAESMRDIAVAYYAAERWIRFLATTFGEERLVALLRELGERKLFEEVFPRVLSTSFDEVEERFRASLFRDLERFRTQTIETPARGGLAETLAAGSAAGASVTERLRAAQAELASGAADRAIVRLERLSAEAPEPEVWLTLARAKVRVGARSDAKEALGEFFSRGADGIEARLLRAQLALEEADLDVVETHAERAASLDPDSAEAFSFLATVAVERGEKERELAAVREVARLSEHNAQAHERVLELVLATGDLAGAEGAVDAAVWAGLGRCETHRLAAAVLRKVGARARATFESDTARLVCTK